MSFVMKVRLVALSGVPRVVGRLREQRFYILFFISAVVLAVVVGCALTAQASARAAQLTPEYYRQKANQQLAWRVEAYYFTWHALLYGGPLEERALVTDWTCKSTLRFPVVTPLAEELAAMELEPLTERPRDFRLSCVVRFNKGEKPVTISFARFPLSVCINGQPFKLSWKLCLRVSDFLPYKARSQFLGDLREDWHSEGYPEVPAEEEGEKEGRVDEGSPGARGSD